MDPYIGKLLDNRHEILELIGTGGMARVYKARDHRLNRLVAIKILREDLAHDAEFRRRFHDESQAVAMLSHPNIVAVYDVSRSSDLEYIVMELIDGITLKQYMQRKGNKLNWREALHFTIQIVKALGYAHSRGIIHRDIKPHNIMVLRDGSVKLADFGIARVSSSSHSTLTQEALGSVHYISPEQARGSHIDARSDLYSAGVVLYEMITGRLPFEGDSPVSVAIQHINSIPLSPREIDPDIPEALEAITMKAMAPDPDDRYPTADDMLADLEEFRKNPNVNIDYRSIDVPLDDYEEDVDRTRRIQSSRQDTDRRRRTDQEHYTEPEHRRPRQERRYSDDYDRDRYPEDRDRDRDRERDRDRDRSRDRRRSRYDDPDYDFDRDDDYRRRRNDDDDDDGDDGGRPRWVLPVAVIAVLIFLAIVIFILLRTFASSIFDPAESNTKEVPDLLGQIYEDVRDSRDILGSDFNVTVGRSVEDESEAGTILEQDPKGGTEVEIPKDGYEITVTVSAGAEPILMPDLEGKESREAIIELQRLGISSANIVTRTEKSDVERNCVISTNPSKDSPITTDSRIELVVSDGPDSKSFPMPELTGLTRERALSIIDSSNLDIGDITEDYDESNAGTVIYQYPRVDDDVSEGTKVNLIISKGPQPAQTKPDDEDEPNPGNGNGTGNDQGGTGNGNGNGTGNQTGNGNNNGDESKPNTKPNAPDESQEPEAPPAPKEVTKQISYSLPDTGGTVNLQVLLDGAVVLNKDWDTSQSTTATFSVTGSGTQTLAFYVDGVLIETWDEDFSS